MQRLQATLVPLLIGLIIAGTTAWLTLGRVAVTRAEMTEAIIPQERQMQSMAEDLKSISVDMAAMKTKQAVLEQKIDMLAEQIKELRAK